MKYSLGLHKSPYDKNDWLVKSFLDYKGLPIRGGVPNKELTPVRSQGNEGACVLFALVTGIMEYLNNVIDYPEHKELIELSPRLPYEEAKLISGNSEGTTLTAGVKAAIKFGTCLEKDWRYYPNEIGSHHPEAYKRALKFRLKNYYARITTVEELKGALNDPRMRLVLGGVEVFKGMLDTKDGVVPDPSCNDRWFGKKGNHGICINHYDATYTSSRWSNPGGVDFKNSWGTKWANGGFGKLSFDYLKTHMIDAIAVIDIDDPEDYKIETVGMLPEKDRKELWV